jgi:hypothetical protein
LPIGPYKDFDDCVKAQLKKGKSEESAKKICGALEQRTSESDKGFCELLTKDVSILEEGNQKFLVGILSSSKPDRGGDIISEKLIEKWAFENNVIPLLSVHQNHWQHQVGLIKERRVIGENEALYIKAALLKSTPVAKEFTDYLDEIKSLGGSVGLSIGAANPVKEDFLDSETGENYTKIVDAELVEGSVVPIGMNKDAFGYLAKKYNQFYGGSFTMAEEENKQATEKPAEEPVKEQKPVEEPKPQSEGSEEKEESNESSEPSPQKDENKEAGFESELKKIYKKLEKIEKRDEKTIVEVVKKALGSIKPIEKGVVEDNGKNSGSYLSKSLWKEEEV